MILKKIRDRVQKYFNGKNDYLILQLLNTSLEIAKESIDSIINPVILKSGDLVIVRHPGSSVYKCAAHRIPQGEDCMIKSGTRGMILYTCTIERKAYVILVKNQKYKLGSECLTLA